MTFCAGHANIYVLCEEVCTESCLPCLDNAI